MRKSNEQRRETEQQRQAPSIDGPAWFEKMREEYLVRWRAYEPFPFDQPSDTHNYLSLHQNDYLRLSNHPEVIAAKNSANARSGGGPMASISTEAIPANISSSASAQALHERR